MIQITILNKLQRLIIFLLYNILQILFLPFFILILPFLFFHKRFYYHFWERFGIIPKLQSNSIFVHSASVGEWNGILPFVRLLMKRGYSIMASTFTDTGLKNIQKDKSATAVLLPFDFLILQVIFLLKVKPQKIIITETELWPNFIFLAHFMKIPLYLINARMSDKHYKTYKKIKWFYQSLFDSFQLILTQDRITEKRLKNLGVHTSFQFIGTTKFDGIKKSKMSNTEQKYLLSKLGANKKTKIIVAGSTRREEYQYVFEAFQKLEKQFPNVKLILVPRHLENISKYQNYFDEHNVSVQFWSKIKHKASDRIIIVDVMGLLQKLYSIAHISFIGGTIAPIGGHNPIEAAIFETVIVHGNSISNNPVAFELLTKNNASVRVNKNNLYRKLRMILSDSMFQKKMSRLPYQVLSAHSGVSQKILSLVFSSNDIKNKNTNCLFLLPLSFLYYLGYKIDSTIKKLQQKKIPQSFVISIGNISVGGTGKTPFVIFLANALKQYRPVILTRGYKSKIKNVVLRTYKKDANLYGDEPILLAQNTTCPVVIASDRYKGALLVNKKYNLFILDDGFQHRQLYRHIDIVLLDVSSKANLLLPAGKLREPFSVLKRAHYVILNKISMISNDEKIKIEQLLVEKYGIKKTHIFSSDYIIEGLFLNRKKIPIKTIQNKKILAFSGIGNHTSFQYTILSLFPNSMIKFHFWNDHHQYDSKSVKFLNQYIQAGYSLITTEKDFVKLKNWKLNIYIVKIKLKLNRETEFLKILQSQIKGENILTKSR